MNFDEKTSFPKEEGNARKKKRRERKKKNFKKIFILFLPQ